MTDKELQALCARVRQCKHYTVKELYEVMRDVERLCQGDDDFATLDALVEILEVELATRPLTCSRCFITMTPEDTAYWWLHNTHEEDVYVGFWQHVCNACWPTCQVRDIFEDLPF